MTDLKQYTYTGIKDQKEYQIVDAIMDEFDGRIDEDTGRCGNIFNLTYQDLIDKYWNEFKTDEEGNRVKSINVNECDRVYSSEIKYKFRSADGGVMLVPLVAFDVVFENLPEEVLELVRDHSIAVLKELKQSHSDYISSIKAQAEKEEKSAKRARGKVLKIYGAADAAYHVRPNIKNNYDVDDNFVSKEKWLEALEAAKSGDRADYERRAVVTNHHDIFINAAAALRILGVGNYKTESNAVYNACDSRTGFFKGDLCFRYATPEQIESYIYNVFDSGEEEGSD